MTLRSEDHTAYHTVWRNSLILSDKGAPKALLANVLHALRECPDWHGVLAYDEFAMTTTLVAEPPWHEGPFSPRTWSDSDTVRLAEWCQRQGINIGTKDAEAAVETIAREEPRHPIRTYLGSLKWDGERRVASWLSTYLGVAASDYVSAVGRCFLVGAVARVMQPGSKVDTMLILEGPQGVGKSTALAILGGEWFSDEIAELGSKDAAMQAHAAWIIELSELDAMSKAEATRTKAFLSRTVDKYRPPYGRRVIDAPRQCAFVGTTNGDIYLKDTTGGRRFWPVVVGKIETAALRRDRNQLWAEAVRLFRDRAKWWLDTEALLAASAEEQADRQQRDPWEEDIHRFLVGKTSVTTRDILVDCFGLEATRRDKAAEMRVAGILRMQGFERRQIWNGGERAYLYARRS